jgi:hypothetical protein
MCIEDALGLPHPTDSDMLWEFQRRMLHLNDAIKNTDAEVVRAFLRSRIEGEIAKVEARMASLAQVESDDMATASLRKAVDVSARGQSLSRYEHRNFRMFHMSLQNLITLRKNDVMHVESDDEETEDDAVGDDTPEDGVDERPDESVGGCGPVGESTGKPIEPHIAPTIMNAESSPAEEPGPRSATADQSHAETHVESPAPSEPETPAPSEPEPIAALAKFMTGNRFGTSDPGRTYRPEHIGLVYAPEIGSWITPDRVAAVKAIDAQARAMGISDEPLVEWDEKGNVKRVLKEYEPTPMPDWSEWKKTHPPE